MNNDINIAILIPCYNEEISIAKVIHEFQKTLPGYPIYVYDNNSTDKTAQVAVDAGAIVRNESHKGKGNVIRRMFADIDADIYLLIDGDNTYDIQKSPELIKK